MGSYRWDIGATAEIGGAIKAGARESVIGTGYQMSRELIARSKATANGETPMSEEQFNAAGHNEWMTYSDDLYPDVIEARKDYRVGAMVNEELTKDNTWYGNLFWSMVGSTAADLPFMLMPASAVAKGAQATTKGLRMGSTVTQASKLERALAVGQVKGIRRMAAADLAKKATKEQFVENSAIYWGNRYFEGDYQESDFLLDMALGPGIATGLGAPTIFKTKRIARINRNLIVDKKSLEQAVELGDVGGIARILERNSSTFKSEVEKDPDLSRAMKLPWTELQDPKNAADLGRLKSFLSDNEDALWYQNLKGIIPRDMNLTPAESVAKQVADRDAIVEATVTGNYENLTGEQLEFVLEADVRTEQQRRIFEEDQRISEKEEILESEISRNRSTQGVETPRRIVQEVSDRYRNLEADVAATDKELSSAQGRKKPKKAERRRIEELKKRKAFLKEERSRQKVIEPMVESMDEGMALVRTLKDSVSALALRGKEAPVLPLLKRSDALLNEMEDIMEKLAAPTTNTFEVAALNIRSKEVQAELGRIKKDTLKSPAIKASSTKKRGETKEPKDKGPKGGGTPPDAPRPRDLRPKAEPTPEPTPDLEAQSTQLEMELEANKVDRAKAAAERRAEKRREVEKRQKVYAKSSKEQGSRNTENISKHLEQSAGWATTSYPNLGKSIDGFRQYLASLIDAEAGELSLDVTVDKLIKLVDSDKLEYAPEVMLDIHGIKTTHAKARGVASNYFKDPKKNEQYIGPDNLDEGLSRRLNQLDLDVSEGRMDSADAAKTFNEYAIEMETAATVRRLHSESIFKKKRAELDGFSPKKIIKYLKSSIDGLNRSGINLKSPAIQNAINAEITISQAPMHEILTKHKLYDAFIDGDNELMSDIMQSNRTGEIPERWKGENEAMFKEILESYKQSTEALNGELNQYGANIRFLEGHSGVSQRWDSQTLLAAGYDKWSSHMMDAMDWEATRRNLGGVMAKERNEFGFAQDWVPAEQEKYLQSMYDELTAPRTDEDHPSMDIAKSFGRHRNIALKPEAEVEILSLYSGHDSMGQLWLDQVRYKAEMTAITRELGNNPIPTFRRLVEDAGLSEGKNTSRKKGVVGQKLHELDMKTMDWSLQYLTGKLDNPADLDVAQFGKTTRQISHILFLWQSTISAITDMPMAIHTVSQLGGTAPTATMVSAFGRALRRRFHGDEPNMSSYLTQHGANFDAMMSAGARHMGLPDSKTAGSVISRMSEATFALNGLNAWTGIMQEAFIDVMTRDMASYIKAGKIDPSLRLSLEAAGVTEAEFLALGDFVENVAGVDRLNINNEKVSVETKRKLMAFLAKYRDEAIMMPDASTAGMIRAGTQAGTLKGEVMRTMFQYQSFPLAMNRIAARKFLVNPEGGRPWTTDQVTFSNTIGFIGGMLAMSYVATVLKDLANGREPMHMGNMTGESWVRLVNQSGMGGMLQSLMEIGTGNPKALLAPIPSTALKVAGSDSIGEAIYQSRNIWSVGSMPIVAPVIQKAVAAVFDDAVGLHFDQLNTFHKMNTDQDPLFYAPR